MVNAGIFLANVYPVATASGSDTGVNDVFVRTERGSAGC